MVDLKRIPAELQGEFKSNLESGEFYVEDGFIFHELEEMPLDKGGAHATGREYFDTESGRWRNEYAGEPVW